MRAEALHSFVPYGDDKANQLPLYVGDVVQVVKKDTSGWWAGHKEGGSQNGWFPAGIVRVLEASSAPSPTQQSLTAVPDATSSASATVHSVWSGACTDNGHTVCQPPEMHSGPALAPAPLVAAGLTDGLRPQCAAGLTTVASTDGVRAANTPQRRESMRVSHQICTSHDPLRFASPTRVRITRKQHSLHGSSCDITSRRPTSPLAVREGPTRMATPIHREVPRVASPLILSREAGRCTSPKHFRRERQGVTTAGVKDDAYKRVSSQALRSSQRQCNPSSLECHPSPSVSKRQMRGVPVSACQSGRQLSGSAHLSDRREDLCRAVPSDRRGIPSHSMMRDVSNRKGDVKRAAVTLQCQTSPETPGSCGRGRGEEPQCLERELQCSRREWNKVAERQFQLEEELRNLRKEQEMKFTKDDCTVEVGQKLGRLKEDVDAKEKRLSKLEAMLDGCDFAALAARASDHSGVSVRELVNAIERRSSIGTPPCSQKHHAHQLDQQHLMPKHQQQCQHDQSQELHQQWRQQQQQQQSSSPWQLTRPLLRHAAGGS